MAAAAIDLVGLTKRFGRVPTGHAGHAAAVDDVTCRSPAASSSRCSARPAAARRRRCG